MTRLSFRYTEMEKDTIHKDTIDKDSHIRASSPDTGTPGRNRICEPSPRMIRAAGEILRKGGLVAFPTETVYGLGGNALDPEASHKIYAAKGRPSDNPLIVHIADLDALPYVAASIPPGAAEAARRLWPGPLTMILPKTDRVPYATTGGLETVAVRLPSHPVARDLIRAAGGYVAAPSANTSGKPSPTKARHVLEDLGDAVDMILDGGEAEIGLESTIVDFTVPVPMVLRPGYYGLEKLKEVLGEVRMDPGLLKAGDGQRPKAPGMKYRHYAPKAQLTIVEGSREAVVSRIAQLVRSAVQSGLSPGILCSDETAGRYPAVVVKAAGSLTDEEAIAHNLYEILREFDEAGVDVIYSEAFHTPHMGTAIMNRLLKAAGHKVLQAEERK